MKRRLIYLSILICLFLIGFKKRYLIARHLTLIEQKTYGAVADKIESSDKNVTVENAFPGFNFTQPTCMKLLTKNGLETLYVSELSGKLYSLDLTKGKREKKLIVDISSQNSTTDFGGLLGFEVQPDKNRIYLHYNSSKNVVQVSAFETKTDFEKEHKILTINPTYHGGGTLALDNAGNLFISVGDSKRYDSDNSAQDLSKLQGKLLRIYPDSIVPTKYYIPKTNPFKNNHSGYREEIYAYGFRNPFRYSIHPWTGEIYLGDVGEDHREEINRIQKGGNYGWKLFEGNRAFQQEATSPTKKLHKPMYEYKHGLAGYSCYMRLSLFRTGSTHIKRKINLCRLC